MSRHSSRPLAALLASALASVLAGNAAAAPSVSPGPRIPLQAAPKDAGGNERFIIKYRDSAPTANSIQAVTAFNAALASVLPARVRSAYVGARQIRRLASGARVIAAPQVLDATQTAALLTQLKSDPAVVYAQPDYRRHALELIPNDRNYPLQWHYSHAVSGIRAPSAWDTASGRGVVVAVLDTGYLDHADLAANLVPGYDFIHDPEVGNDGDGRDPDAHDPGDWQGSRQSSFHGTHVAGTVAAVTNNGMHTAGVSWGARVQPVRVLGTGGGYTSDIADAIVWASGGTVDGVPDNATPAEVINLSLGGQGACSEDPATQEAIDGALSRGTTVVVAAGNSNAPAAQFSPASCNGVITVGATGYTGARSSYSNYGPAVTLAAPGGDAVDANDDNNYVWSLGNSGLQAPVASPAGDRTVGMQGTSMASPHVAAVVALMQDARANAGLAPLTPAQVKQLLRSTARALPQRPPSNRGIGAGIVDAAAAVAAAGKDVPVEMSELLGNRETLAAQFASAGEVRLYRIVVPAGSAMLSLRSFGGSGDMAMYVAHERTPSAASHDLRSLKRGTAQTVQISRPAAGTWFIALASAQGFEDVSVMGLY